MRHFAQEIGCLDTNASVAAVRELSDKQIKTIVIGFGADFNGTSASARKGAETLNGMAEAGQFPRTCQVDADCGTGDTCDDGHGPVQPPLLLRRVTGGAGAALREISEKVLVDDPCVLDFDARSGPPTKSELVVVYLNGERLSAGADTWS